MTPEPDCGETSYVGHGRLQGYNMLVTGADSAIGRAAAIAYAKEGANVALNYLPSEEQDALEVKEVIEKLDNVRFFCRETSEMNNLIMIWSNKRINL